MAKEERAPGKGKVKDIAATLLNSEIPEIRTIINELNECTKQLEAHSQKLQNYAVKIQELSGEEVGEPVETNLVERLKGLEKALTEAFGKAAKAPAKPRVEAVKVAREEVRERAREEVEVEKAVAPAPGLFPRIETYITPEGFVVRRRRY